MTSGQTTNAFICLRVPSALVDALVDLQGQCEDRVDPQQAEHIHITLGFLHGADEPRLAEARELVEGGAWTAPAIRLSGEVRHGSWNLQNDPAYHYDKNLVQKGEQVRLGVEQSPELARVHEDITQGLEIVEDGFWPHVTLGLAREDFPVADVQTLNLPVVSGPAPSVDVQREVSTAEFTMLIRKDLPTP
ncbi:2'-5' RNA ligase family protein [Streptomyces sp. NPDC088746]|uniref:2'-5' RNA ligase family protein n=1 Tax=Streptomyces sp. NPDC088746 TaxID=3365885 RepID=UPI0037F79121